MSIDKRIRTILLLCTHISFHNSSSITSYHKRR